MVISRLSLSSKSPISHYYTITKYKPDEVIRKDRDLWGTSSSPWTLVEFGDYQCPGCIDSHNIINSLLSKKTNIRYQFRHYPLTSIHIYAEYASLISIESERRNQFSKIHEELFSLKGKITKQTLIKLCNKHNIKNISKIIAEKSLKTDLESVNKLNIDSTPTFFLCTPNNNVLKIHDIKTIDRIIRNPKL